jgi:hypothetical protein
VLESLRRCTVVQLKRVAAAGFCWRWVLAFGPCARRPRCAAGLSTAGAWAAHAWPLGLARRVGYSCGLLVSLSYSHL